MLFPKNYQKVQNNHKNFYKFSKFLNFYSINNIRYFLKNEEYVLIKKDKQKNINIFTNNILILNIK